MVGAQHLIEARHGVGQAQGGPGVPDLHRILQDPGEGVSELRIGEQPLRVVLLSDCAQVVDAIKNLSAPLLPLGTPDVDGVHHIQEPDHLLTDVLPIRRFGFPLLPDGPAPELRQNDCRAVF